MIDLRHGDRYGHDPRNPVLKADSPSEDGSKARVMRYLSVCSGIEAATVAWEPLGWQVVAFAEIDKFPSAVLAYHYPDVPNLGDMTKINGVDYYGIDVLVGGTPCQSFSIAGLRHGLEDERGNLALEFVRLAYECDPAFVVWENVPGVLSDRGNAFGCFLAALAGEDAPLLPPGGRWADAGYVLGPRRTIAWRVLDAQYFGLAQRRRRVFVVACPRNGADPRKILFEFDSVRRDTAPGRETRQDIAGTLESSFGRSRGAGTPPGAITFELGPSGNRSVSTAPTLDTRCKDGPIRNQVGIAVMSVGYVPEIVSQAISCKWSKGTSGPAGDEHHNLLAVTLPLTGNQYGDHASREDLLVPMPSPGAEDSPIPINTQIGLRHNAMGERTGLGIGEPGDPAYTLQGARSHAVLLKSSVRRLTPTECEVLQGFPRNYTLIPYKRPFADLPRQILLRSYNRYLARTTRQGKTPLPLDELIKCADGPRYKALGNSMAVPVMRWIGERIARHV